MHGRVKEHLRTLIRAVLQGGSRERVRSGSFTEILPLLVCGCCGRGGVLRWAPVEEAELELAFNNRSVSEEVKAHFTSDTVSKEAVWVRLLHTHCSGHQRHTVHVLLHVCTQLMMQESESCVHLTFTSSTVNVK